MKLDEYKRITGQSVKTSSEYVKESVQKISTESKPEAAFDLQLKALKLPEPQKEYKAIANRRFRIDRAWPDRMIAVEIEGGTYSRGRHVRPLGFEMDCEKYNLLTLDGWKVFRFTTNQIMDGRALLIMTQLLRDK